MLFFPQSHFSRQGRLTLSTGQKEWFVHEGESFIDGGGKMEKLVNEKKIIILYPKLAAKIGLNEAIMLQQIHYWLKESKHHIDGRMWVYNTYQGWQEQLSFWSVETIKRIIRKLEKEGYLLSANYNRLKMDKTKWYSINYEKVSELWDEETDSTGQVELSYSAECSTEEVTLTEAIPKSTSNSTTKSTSEKELHNLSSNEHIAETKTISNSSELEVIIHKVFPKGLRKDWIDSIYRVYDFYSEDISLLQYKQVLKSVSEQKGGITKFEKYLERCVKNELSSKEATTGESVLRKKVIREEMVPYWLENGNIHQQEEKKPPILEKGRDARFHELMERVKNLSRGESIPS